MCADLPMNVVHLPTSWCSLTRAVGKIWDGNTSRYSSPTALTTTTPSPRAGITVTTAGEDPVKSMDAISLDSHSLTQFLLHRPHHHRQPLNPSHSLSKCPAEAEKKCSTRISQPSSSTTSISLPTNTGNSTCTATTNLIIPGCRPSKCRNSTNSDCLLQPQPQSIPQPLHLQSSSCSHQ